VNGFDVQLAQAARALRAAERVVLFTGAGISAESGIAAFRDDDGFWKQFPPEQFANWRAIIRTAGTQPRRLAEFAAAIFQPVAIARPNARRSPSATA
jgi:NAD-dependent deacetylase